MLSHTLDFVSEPITHDGEQSVTVSVRREKRGNKKWAANGAPPPRGHRFAGRFADPVAAAAAAAAGTFRRQ